MFDVTGLLTPRGVSEVAAHHTSKSDIGYQTYRGARPPVQ